MNQGVRNGLPNWPKQDKPTNCFQACVASVLGLSISEVPAGCDGATWDWDEFQGWLETLGLQAVEVAFGGGGTLYPVVAETICIVCGPSPRPECPSGLHAVVAKFVGAEGFELVHDPHPSDGFIAGEPVSACFFVPLDPGQFVKGRR